MKCIANPICRSAACVTAVILLVAGCGESPSGPATGTVAAKPKPEESFELIMATIKRRIEDTPSGFVAERNGERSRLMASNKITSQIFPPAKEGDPYRAEVVVFSETNYSLRRSVEEKDESTKKDDQQDNQGSGSVSLSDPPNGGTGLDILDPGLVSSSGGGTQSKQAPPSANESIISRRKDAQQRTFELEYRDGRWLLLTKPDPETERAIGEAFSEALSRQI